MNNKNTKIKKIINTDNTENNNELRKLIVENDELIKYTMKHVNPPIIKNEDSMEYINSVVIPIDRIVGDILLSLENLKSRNISLRLLSIYDSSLANRIKCFLDIIGLKYDSFLLGYAYNPYEVNAHEITISELVSFLTKCSNNNKFNTDEQYKFNECIKYLIEYYQITNNQCRFNLSEYKLEFDNDELGKLRDDINSLFDNDGEKLTQLILSSKSLLNYYNKNNENEFE